MDRHWRCLLLAAGILGLARTPLYAQASFDVAPLFAYYRPIGSFAPASVYSTALPGKPSDLSGMAWGVEAHAWLSNRWGIQLQAAIANSTIGGDVVTPAGSTTRPAPAQVVVVTAQAQYDLSPSPERYRIWVSAGPGVVRRGGEAYSESGVGSPTSVGAALGVGLDVPLNSRLKATAGLESMVYRLDVPFPPYLRNNPGSYESGTQDDLLLHVGIAWRWQ